ncbi:hypothetical protein J6K27_000041 [Rhodococcus qingshengii]|uniref:hypothetical protein n=1 Tax=Rhodococcus qingshengii TaxID=334542 RepID=UPI001AEF516E|nr:hypothetical protein [Rhodococcus qingshengii]QTS00545.1 hypothetical protein J6K27_000041 [Rhodococcus qingshengii]
MAGWFGTKCFVVPSSQRLGVARVAAQEILVVSVERLLADETLSNRVKRDVLARR